MTIDLTDNVFNDAEMPLSEDFTSFLLQPSRKVSMILDLNSARIVSNRKIAQIPEDLKIGLHHIISKEDFYTFYEIISNKRNLPAGMPPMQRRLVDWIVSSNNYNHIGNLAVVRREDHDKIHKLERQRGPKNAMFLKIRDNLLTQTYIQILDLVINRDIESEFLNEELLLQIFELSKSISF